MPSASGLPLLEPLPFIDIAALPRTPFERLVGRKRELKRLDEAWTDCITNILSLIAEGGAGKTALLNQWLKVMQTDRYRKAEAVLGWSFYNQGTKERATSADPFLDWALARLRIEIESSSATAKADAIADALAQRRVLLVLDGVEPLQFGLERQQGELKDVGLRRFLRRFAAMPAARSRGLVVITSRLPIKDIAHWKDGAAPVLDLDALSDKAGSELLLDNGVRGTKKELRATVQDFGGLPLALDLLASFLKETQLGDIRRRDRIRQFFADPENPRHDHAKRVMESYEREWLVGQPVAHAVMRIVGLFNRPASSGCLTALRQKPAISGLTDALVEVDQATWQRTISRLREVRLLSPQNPYAPEAIDAHPLVREWFDSRLERTNPNAWRAAHRRIYEHLRDTTEEGDAPTLEDLSPLYQAIPHGCRAGLHDDAQDLWRHRMCRGSGFRSEFYTFRRLGAYSSDLDAMRWFFKTPYVELIDEDNGWYYHHTGEHCIQNRAWWYHNAAICLRGQGNIAEAMPPQEKALNGYVQWGRHQDALGIGSGNNWDNASINANTLAQLQLLAGDIDEVRTKQEKLLWLAEKSVHVDYQIAWALGVHGHSLYAAGLLEEASKVFVLAELAWQKEFPEASFLADIPGLLYCDLLISQRLWTIARDRARLMLESDTEPIPGVLALKLLTVGRAHLALALSKVRKSRALRTVGNDVRAASLRIDAAVENFNKSGRLYAMPEALLARASFRRYVGDWDGAAFDLYEVKEIAEPGAMRLFLCDMELEKARLAWARIEGVAPLRPFFSGELLETAMAEPGEAARLKRELAKSLARARGLIAECGYHLRDEEVTELDAVATGSLRFVDLPPRV
ncbi:MAG: ATP-binding protein [Bradyrhizobium sp.]